MYAFSLITHTCSPFSSPPIAGGEREYYIFDGMSASPYVAGEPESNMLHTSRTLPDPRGGLKGAGEDRTSAALCDLSLCW